MGCLTGLIYLACRIVVLSTSSLPPSDWFLSNSTRPQVRLRLETSSIPFQSGTYYL